MAPFSFLLYFSFISKIIHQRDVKGCHQGIQERSTKDKAKQEKQKLETKGSMIEG